MLPAITDPHASIILPFPSILVIFIFGQVWFNESKLPQEIFFPQPTRKEESRRAKVIYYMDINIPSPSTGHPPPLWSHRGFRKMEAGPMRLFEAALSYFLLIDLTNKGWLADQARLLLLLLLASQKI